VIYIKSCVTHLAHLLSTPTADVYVPHATIWQLHRPVLVGPSWTPTANGANSLVTSGWFALHFCGGRFSTNFIIFRLLSVPPFNHRETVESYCDSLKYLSTNQRAFCLKHPTLIHKISEGVNLGIKECRHHFR